jgi:hypothetical protein
VSVPTEDFSSLFIQAISREDDPKAKRVILFLFAESTNRIIQYNSFRFIHQSQKFFHDAKILQRNTVCNNKISLNECNPITTYWYLPKNGLRNIKSKALSRGYQAL